MSKRARLALVAVLVLAGCGTATESVASSQTAPARLEWSESDYVIPENVTTVWVEIHLWREPTPAQGYLDSWAYAAIERDSYVGDPGPNPPALALPFPLTDTCSPCVRGVVWERGSAVGSWEYRATWDLDPTVIATMTVTVR